MHAEKLQIRIKCLSTIRLLPAAGSMLMFLIGCHSDSAGKNRDGSADVRLVLDTRTAEDTADRPADTWGALPIDGKANAGSDGGPGLATDAAGNGDTRGTDGASTTTDGGLPLSDVPAMSMDSAPDRPPSPDSPSDALTAGTKDSAVDTTLGPTNCSAWVRRLADQCPEHDTFLGYLACATNDGWLRAGQKWRWSLDAFISRPPVGISPPDPRPTAVDCSAMPALVGNPGLPTAAAYYCDLHPTECTSLANNDRSKELHKPNGTWMLVGAGTNGQGFMGVTIDGQDMGKWTYVVLYRTMVVYSDAGVPIDWPTAQVAVLYWNGFVRLKTPAAGDDYGFGTSVVLGPFAPAMQDPTKVANPDLHPRIETIAFDSTSLASANPAATAIGGWYSGAGQGTASKILTATWQLSWVASDTKQASMHADVNTTVVGDFQLPNGKLGVGSLSSMWVAADMHDSDTYSIGPIGSLTAAGNASSVTGETTPVGFGLADRLSFATLTSTHHNSGSPDIALQIATMPSLQ